VTARNTGGTLKEPTPKHAVNIAFSILDMKEDEILETLPETLYQIEAVQTCSNLGAFSSTDKRRKAEEFIEENLTTLRQAIHSKWKDETREKFERDTMLFSDFISDIGDSLGHYSTFVSLAMIVAAWIINKGIDKFCH
jgi:hypothetical protein